MGAPLLHGDPPWLPRCPEALRLEPIPRRRLDRFSLVIDTCKLKAVGLRCFLDFAADCRAEDLHVDIQNNTVADKLNFHLRLASPHLARLSLRRLKISMMSYKGVQPFRALEVILLHCVSITEAAFRKMIALCPSLRTLDLRDCACDYLFFWEKDMAWPANLRSITVVECDGTTNLHAVSMPGLCSFRYRGSFVDETFSLPGHVALADLYLYFDGLVSTKYHRALPNDLSGLTVLTMSSDALQVAPLLLFGEDQLLKLSNLRELHLLMSKMEDSNLADIYVFLKACQCHNLEKLFVQLPKSRYGSTKSSLDEVWEEPPEEPLEDGLANLVLVKVMNFNWHLAEVQLVSFLLRKASSLQKLLIVSSGVTPLDVPGAQEADLLLVKEALANGKMMLSESDDTATQPYHSEAFFKLEPPAES